MIASTTNLDRYYQLLEIQEGVSIDELKTAYRLLARKLHPDLNPGDTNAHQRFISLNQAYQILLDRLQTQPVATTPNSARKSPTYSHSTARVNTEQKTTRSTTSNATTKAEEDLKWQLYYELQSLLKQQQFLKAIVSIEGLAHRLPHDLQVCQWQGIIYSQYAHQLIERREFDKARSYLRKAVKVDPQNRQLWQEIDRAFSRITQLS